MKVNPKIVVFSLVFTALGVMTLVLVLKLGLGFGGGDTNVVEDSPDQSEKVSNSQNERLDNSEEVSSHNTTSYHVSIGSGIIIMVLVTVIGGLTTALKYRQKTNVRLAKERRLLQAQVQAKEEGEIQEPDVQLSSNVSFHPNHPNLPNLLPHLQYQASPYVEQNLSIALDASNQASHGYYPQLQHQGVPRKERQQWFDRTQFGSAGEDSSENMAEVNKWKSEVEVLKKQNQTLVNKYRLLQGSTEADI